MSKPKATNGSGKAVVDADKFGLVLDQSKLMSAIDAVHRQQSSLDKRFHMLACASLYMAAVHGQVGPLNRLYVGMKPAMQTALKIWVAYVASDLKAPNGLGAGEGWIRQFDSKKKIDGGLEEKREEGFFRVITDRMSQRKHFADDIEVIVKGTKETKRQYLGRNVEPFYDTKITGSNVNVFKAVDILKALENLRRRADKEDSKIDSRVRRILDAAYKDIDTLIPLEEIEEADVVNQLPPPAKAQGAPASANVH